MRNGGHERRAGQRAKKWGRDRMIAEYCWVEICTPHVEELQLGRDQEESLESETIKRRVIAPRAFESARFFGFAGRFACLAKMSARSETLLN